MAMNASNRNLYSVLRVGSELSVMKPESNSGTGRGIRIAMSYRDHAAH